MRELYERVFSSAGDRSDGYAPTMTARANALMVVRQSLQQFVESRANAPREQKESKFGELLLYLVRLAEQHDVDWIGSALDQVGDRARRRRRAVSEVRSDDDGTRS